MYLSAACIIFLNIVLIAAWEIETYWSNEGIHLGGKNKFAYFFSEVEIKTNSICPQVLQVSNIAFVSMTVDCVYFLKATIKIQMT